MPILTETNLDDANIIFEALKEAGHVVIVSPPSYDVDSLCSCLLVHELLTLESSVGSIPKAHTLFCATKPTVGDNDLLKFVEPELDLFSTSISGYVAPLVIIVLDYGSSKTCQISDIFDKTPHILIGIDHHPQSAEDFPSNSIRLINVNAASTTAIIYRLLRYRFPFIARRIATYTALGIMADIGGKLTHPKVNAETLQILANLIKIGIPWEEIQEAAKPQMTPQRLDVWTKANKGLTFLTDKIVSLVVYRRTLAEWAGTRKDIETFFGTIMCSLEDVDLAILIFEQEDGTWKISFRSRNPKIISAAEFAKIFNGGGHHHAAAAIYLGDPFDAERMILSYLSRHLNLGSLLSRPE